MRTGGDVGGDALVFVTVTPARLDRDVQYALELLWTGRSEGRVTLSSISD